MNQPPQNSSSSTYRFTPQRERGGCLTTWLILSTVLGVVAAYGVFQLLNAVSLRPEIIPNNKMPGLILFTIVVLGSLWCLLGIWRWRKWGVYGIAVFSILSPFAEQSVARTNATDWIAPFVQIGILYFLVQSRWDDFK